MEITGKVAIVTGGSAGIGRATCYALGRAGAAAVVVADVDEPGGQETVAELKRRGCRAEFERVDVGDAGQMTELFRGVESRHGGVDIVHNNAGLVSGNAAWPATPLSRIEAVARVNLFGVYFGTRIAIDALSRRGGGTIVNTASVAAFGPMPTDPIYSSTKAAIVNFTQACAFLRETHNIRVNAVLPGVTDTAILLKTGDGSRAAAWLEPVLAAITKLTPEDIADAVLALVTDDSRAGEALLVDNPATPGDRPHVVRISTPLEFAQVTAKRATLSGASGEDNG